MKLRKKTAFRWLLAAAAVVLAVGLIAPRLDADRFGERVKESLRKALGRDVEIGKVHLSLFDGPGFSVEKVVIHDDPAMGLEPFAYVESLEARVSFASFWTGRLQFSSLRLSDAAITLTRPEAGHWNFQSLLSRTAGAAASAGVHLPEIQVRDGRINFKFANTKSTFYFANVRMDAVPPSSLAGDWRLRFEGEPARSDRGSQGFGEFTVRGRWHPGHGAGGRIDATVELENNSISDLVRLAQGYDLGVHGKVSSRARLVGPLSGVDITGNMQIQDIYRWDLLPPHGDTWPLDFRGKLDLISQTLWLETAPAAGGALPLELEFRATGYLSQPRWAALIKLDHLPVAPLPVVARHLGLELPEGLEVSGGLTGVIGYSPETRAQGTLASGETLVKIPDAPPLRLARAVIGLNGDSVHLEPAIFDAGNQSAAIEGEYAWAARAWSARITASGMRVAGGVSGGARLLGSVPVLKQCAKGSWTGQVDYRKEGDRPGAWLGAFRLEDASIPIAGLAEPVEISSARVTLRDDGVTMDRIRGNIGAADLEGECRYTAGASEPHKFRLRIPKLDAQEVERLLMPSLRREENLLARALRLGRARVPEWLETRRVEAAVEIGSLVLKDLPIENVRARLLWDGASIEATDLTARLNEGSITGRLTANLRRAAPAYRASLRFRGLSWMGGAWTGRSVLETAGTGPELMENLRLEGSFKARSVSLAADTEAKDVSGSYAFAMARGLPVFRFSDILITLGDTSFKGGGVTGPDGRIYFDLSDGQTEMRLNATLSPFQFEIPAAKSPGTL
jgi:hypothetical protein